MLLIRTPEHAQPQRLELQLAHTGGSPQNHRELGALVSAIWDAMYRVEQGLREAQAFRLHGIVEFDLGE